MTMWAVAKFYKDGRSHIDHFLAWPEQRTTEEVVEYLNGMHLLTEDGLYYVVEIEKCPSDTE